MSIQPANYLIGGAQPSQNPLSSFEQGLEKGIVLRERRVAREKKKSFEAELSDIVENPSTSKLADLSLRYPEFADQLKTPYEQLSETQQKMELAEASRVYAALKSDKPQIAERILYEQADAYENGGDKENAQATRDFAEMVAISPETALTTSGLFLASILGPDKFASTFSTLENDRRMEKQFPTLMKIKQAQLRKANTEAQRSAINAKFDAQANKLRLNELSRKVELVDRSPVQRSEILPDKSIVMVTKNGDTRVIDPEGNEVFGDERVHLLHEANIYGTELKGMAKAEETANKISQEQAQKGFETIGKVRTNITNLDRAMSALEGGARTGYIMKNLPSLTASSIELQKIQNELGLDIVGAYTFGALSEGELDLALSTALPLNMDEESLMRWLRQKKAAQENVVQYITDQVQFLSQPGNTIGDWTKQVREREQANAAEMASQNPLEVTTPGGTYYFDTPEQAAQYRRAIGL